MSELYERLSALSPQQRALLEARMKQRGLSLPKPQGIAKRAGNGPAPLSIDQEQLWIVDQIEPGNAAYNVSTAMRLTGGLDIAALERAINEIVRRHDVLRTTFHAVDGRPAQVVAPTLVVPLPVTDIAHEADAEGKALRLATQEISRAFDLSRGPLVRARILRLAADDHVLVVVMHHIVADSWSFGVFNQELLALYDAQVSGRTSPLADLPVQYADYAVWQREWLSGELLETKLAHWRNLLAGAPTSIELIGDRPRPPTQSYRGESRALTISEDLTRGLKEIANRERATMFMTMLAAFNVLLFRYSGQRDILIGSPIANRNHPEIQGLIGYFLNMLVLRTRLRASMTFSELLSHVRESSLAAYTHQDLPFARLVQELQPERDVAQNPLFQVCFVYLDFQGQAAELRGLKLHEMKLDAGTAMFDLTLALTENADGLTGHFEYATDLFNSETIERMIGHFKNLLESIVAHPESRLGVLTLIDEAERQQVLYDWNPTASFGTPHTLHERFACQAQRRPDAVAIVAADGSHLSYCELARQANLLAHALRRRGVGPEQVVGLVGERTPQMIVAMLAVLQAGGAYLPLDSSSPPARLQAMLEDATVKLVVAASSQVETIRAAATAAGAEVVMPEEAIRTDASEGECNGGALVDNLAYVIYTSGSTGRPKGVAVTHQSICNRLSWEQHAYPLDETDRVLQITSLNFDVSVCEVLAPLCAGAQLIQAEVGGQKDSAYLAKTIAERDITFINVVPALLHVLLDEPELASCRALRRVYCGGEAMPLALKERFIARSSATLVNLYGPTEATVDTTYWICQADHHSETVPIGKPIANAAVYVLGAGLEPVPVGAPGDLYIGGAGLARAYVSRADLTADLFIPDPFSEHQGTRLYRSGDRARRMADGSLAYLGRADAQVKIRGLRIELGEIEAAIAEHPLVKETAVTLKENANGTKRLAAYVVTTHGESVTGDELRSFARERLPDYMVPTWFVMLKALPLLPSGKLDRQALPEPEASRSAAEAAHAPPRTAVEETLARIWSELLGVEQVGVHDNFFGLGGDSILSIQIVARAKEAGLRLAPRQLFQYQTVADLAAVAGVEQEAAAEQGMISGEVPLTPIQHWFFDQHFIAPHYWNMAVMLESSSALDTAVMRAVIEWMIEHHDALRMRFYKDANGWRQIQTVERGELPFTVVDLTGEPESEQRRAIERIATELQASLDLSAGPLLRVCWFDLGAGKGGRLLIIIHHLVVDAVSWRVLLEDMQSAYSELRAGRGLRPRAKTTSFKQWADSLRAYADSAAALAKLDYWLDQLSKPFPRLPTDDPTGANVESSVQSAVVRLGPEETRALLHDVPGAYRTQINDALLTALAEAFAGWVDAPYLLIEVEGHGREEEISDADLSRTLGWFTAIYPVVLELNQRDGTGERLKHVKEQVRAIPARGIGYGVLRCLSGDATAKRLREFDQPEVSFNYLGQLDSAVDATGFRIAPESPGPTRNPAALRSHLLEIEVSISEGQLQCAFYYSENLHRRQTIERLADGYLAGLRHVIAHCRGDGVKGATPSDFPEARLSQSELNQFLSMIGGSKSGPAT